MKILFIGDVSGRPGRDVIGHVLPDLKKKKDIDFVIANAENSAGGRGVTIDIINELSGYGVDYFTTGEHVWDQRRFHDELHNKNIPLTRPLNYEVSEMVPGKGYDFIDLGKHRLLIINLLGQVFMREQVRSPFWVFDELWNKLKDDGEIEDENENTIVLVDFHAEATSEKVALGWYLKDRVSAFLGTHTHVPTADERVIGEKMGYVTDVGMTGPYDAALWVDYENVINNYKFPMKEKFVMEMDKGAMFNSVLMDFEGSTCKSIERVDRYYS